MSKWCAISECYFDGPHDHATSATTLYTSGTFKATALQLDTWGHCGRCGADTGSADVWQTLCPRCQQLAALEAEIGRAVIGQTMLQKMAVDMAWDGEMDAARLTGDQSDKYHDELSQLIARWRELHAEGAEAEAATERQEGER